MYTKLSDDFCLHPKILKIGTLPDIVDVLRALHAKGQLLTEGQLAVIEGTATEIPEKK